jgi:uncharacterized protein YbcI
MAGQDQRPTGGQLNQAIANAVVRGYHRYVGRGPTRAQAFYRHDIIVVVMHDTLTTAERRVAAAGRGDAVLEMRRNLNLTMRAELAEAVEELTGCRVEAVMSANSIEPDLAADLFVLDRPVPGEDPSGLPDRAR